MTREIKPLTVTHELLRHIVPHIEPCIGARQEARLLNTRRRVTRRSHVCILSCHEPLALEDDPSHRQSSPTWRLSPDRRERWVCPSLFTMIGSFSTSISLSAFSLRNVKNSCFRNCCFSLFFYVTASRRHLATQLETFKRLFFIYDRYFRMKSFCWIFFLFINCHFYFVLSVHYIMF